ncbi:MAG TPA: hypothetical protein VMR46_00490 [Candidatus Paceibacterota bacterium]|nr:hypothetical protein [Candidatus Paceibacterota bacterium]
MAKHHKPKKDFSDNLGGEEEIRETADWRNEHGQPDFVHLQSLAKDGSIEALEKLKSIAEDLDVAYDPTIQPEELIERIRTTVAENGDVSTQPTA